MKLTDGIYGFPQELGDQTIYPAGIETETGLILVDAGMPDQVERLEDELANEGFELRDVEKIILTHQDGDHCGALKQVVDRTDATVFAHEQDTPFIDGRKEPIKTHDERYPAVDVDVQLAGGETFNTAAGRITVHETPGHTPGHISLLAEEQRLLITGDALVADNGLSGPIEKFTPELEPAYESLYRLSTLGFDQAHCFHGGLVDEGAEKVKELFEASRDQLSGFEQVEVGETAFIRRMLSSADVGLSRFQVAAGEKHGARDDPEAGHRHTRQEELYLFLNGSGTMRINAEEVSYAEGTAVRVRPYAFRRIDADEDTDFVVAGAPIQGDETEYRDLW